MRVLVCVFMYHTGLYHNCEQLPGEKEMHKARFSDHKPIPDQFPSPYVGSESSGVRGWGVSGKERGSCSYFPLVRWRVGGGTRRLLSAPFQRPLISLIRWDEFPGGNCTWDCSLPLGEKSHPDRLRMGAHRLSALLSMLGRLNSSRRPVPEPDLNVTLGTALEYVL